MSDTPRTDKFLDENIKRENLVERITAMVSELNTLERELTAATARAEQAEKERDQEAAWKRQYLELADKLEQQRDKAQEDCDNAQQAATRIAEMHDKVCSELAEARRQVYALCRRLAEPVEYHLSMTVGQWRDWSANEARTQTIKQQARACGIGELQIAEENAERI